ncbi:hypothetical protein BKA83DRAFT_4127454 [Pisolithus microcarpus]|nr:hypothetical protein BKA83DRAFT_4127454 [Pisolithus microcarpus]
MAWRELRRPPEQIRPARFIKFVLGSTTHMGEVKYFTRLAIQDVQEENPPSTPTWLWKDVAVITMFSPPDPNLLKLSYHTIHACQHQGEDVRVINVKSITGVVGMVPHRFPGLDCHYFVVEHPSLDITTFGVPYEGEGAQDEIDDDEDDCENDVIPEL